MKKTMLIAASFLSLSTSACEQSHSLLQQFNQITCNYKNSDQVIYFNYYADTGDAILALWNVRSFCPPLSESPVKINYFWQSLDSVGNVLSEEEVSEPFYPLKEQRYRLKVSLKHLEDCYAFGLNFDSL